MTCAEAKHLIIRALPDDFLKDDDNRKALEMLGSAFKLKEKEENCMRCEICGKKFYSGYQIFRYSGMALCERCYNKRSK